MQAVNFSSFSNAKAWSNIGSITDKIQMSIFKISSGNNQYASEDPQNIPFIQRLKSAITELPERINQARDKINLLQSQVSELQIKSDALLRIRELAVAYNNDTLSDSEKENIQTEVDELSKIIEGNTNYTRKIESVGYEITTVGLPDQSIKLHTFETIDVNQLIVSDDEFIVTSTESFLALREIELETTSEEGSQYDLSSESILSSLDERIDNFGGVIASKGAEMNALEYDIKKMQNENAIMNDVYSRYTETDLVEEITNMTKNQIIRNVASEVLKTHSNLEKDNVLALINQL